MEPAQGKIIETQHAETRQVDDNISDRFNLPMAENLNCQYDDSLNYNIPNEDDNMTNDK